MTFTQNAKVSLDRFVRLREMLQITGLPRATVYELMAKNLFPKNYRISPRLVAWKAGDLATWMQSRQHGGSKGSLSF
jgi:prophage regulatory protein